MSVHWSNPILDGSSTNSRGGHTRRASVFSTVSLFIEQMPQNDWAAWVDRSAPGKTTYQFQNSLAVLVTMPPEGQGLAALCGLGTFSEQELPKLNPGGHSPGLRQGQNRKLASDGEALSATPAFLKLTVPNFSIFVFLGTNEFDHSLNKHLLSMVISISPVPA